MVSRPQSVDTKKIGIYRIHKPRTIYKLEPKVNLLRQEISARQLMINTEKRQYLDNDQHRGRNRQSAIDIVLGKSFAFETFYF